MADVNIRYYRVKNGRGFWQPTKAMQLAGFLPMPCGQDGPAAWRRAEERNDAWEAYRRGDARRPTPDVDEPGYIYFLRVADRVKIGFSKRPLSRITDFGTGLPGAPSLFVAVRGRRSDEAKMHRRFAAYRQAGEWFAAGLPLVRSIMRCVAFGRPMHDEPEQRGANEKLEHFQGSPAEQVGTEFLSD